MDRLIPAVIAVAAVAFCLIPRRERTYICPDCGGAFRRRPGMAIHIFDAVLIRCPYCGVTAFMRPSE